MDTPVAKPQPDFRDPKQLMVEVDTLRAQFAELMLHPDRPHPTKVVLWAFLKTMLRDMVMEAPQNLWIQLCQDFAQETYEGIERKVVQREAPRGIILP
jgi:hypothetical protein